MSSTSTPTPGGRRTRGPETAARASRPVRPALAVGVEPRPSLNDNRRTSNSDTTHEPDLNGNQDPSGLDTTPAPRVDFDGSRCRYPTVDVTVKFRRILTAVYNPLAVR